MPGLSFLNKKSFHTTNLKNVEKVWLAEKKAENEQKALMELQKQLEEERQILELRQLQAAQGQVSKTIDNSLDWMYEGPMQSAQQQQQSSEEYLLGKIYKAPSTAAASDTAGVSGVVGQNEYTTSNKSDTKWMNKVASKNDSFTRLHEDPFVLIKQEENKRREKIVNNPVKMEKIKQKVAKEVREKEEKEEARRAKKQARKEKKALKKEAKKSKKKSKEEAKRNAAVNENDKKDADGSSSSSESEADSGDEGGKMNFKRPAGDDGNAHVPNRSARTRSPQRQTSPSPSPPTSRGQLASSEAPVSRDEQPRRPYSHTRTHREEEGKTGRVHPRDHRQRYRPRSRSRSRSHSGEQRRGDTYHSSTGADAGTGTGIRHYNDHKVSSRSRNDDGRSYKDGRRRVGSRDDDYDDSDDDTNFSSLQGKKRRVDEYGRYQVDREREGRGIDNANDNNKIRHSSSSSSKGGQSVIAKKARVELSDAGQQVNQNSMGKDGQQVNQNSMGKDEKDEVQRQKREDEEGKRYGLLSKSNNKSSGSSSSSSDNTNKQQDHNGASASYLGPNLKLLRQREQQERDAEALRRSRLRGSGSGANHNKNMTDAERKQRLSEMEQDANVNDAMRMSRHGHTSNSTGEGQAPHESGAIPGISGRGSSSSNSSRQEEEDNVDAANGNTGNAVFLATLRKQVYSEAGTDMKSRLDQNKHYRQSSADMDSANAFVHK